MKKKKEAKKEQPIERVSFMQIDDVRIAEEVYNPESKKALFIIGHKDKGFYKTGIGYDNYKFVDKLEKNGTIYAPLKDDSLIKGAVLLPSTIQTYTDTTDLLEQIKSFIKKYCDISDTFLTFTSWYVLFTWVYDRFNTVPYLRFRGDTGTGKTRAQDTIGGICYKPCFIAGAVRPAPIYRQIEAWKGTLIIDEADFQQSDEKAEIIKILNCGYQRGKPVLRCKQNDADVLQTFETYCPKLIGTRKDFTDKALESRCITEIMRVTERKDIPYDLPKKFFEEQTELRNRLLCWRLSNWFKIDPDAGLNVELGSLEPRLKQSTSSFASLFANIPELLDDFRLFLRKYQAELIADRAESFDGQIVNALVRLFVEGNIYISSSDIKKELENEGVETKPATIGRHLKSLNIKMKPKKVDGKTKRVVIFDLDMLMVFQRYISDLDLLADAVTKVTVVTEHTDGAQEIEVVQ